MANTKRDVDAISGPLMEEMSIYAMKAQVKELLQEYLRRVALEKPADPIGYLIAEIKERPFVPPPPVESVDRRSEAEKAKWLDLRRDETKMDALRVVFDKFDVRGAGKVSRSQILVAFKADKSLLLENFPKHVNELPKALELLDCGNKEGMVSWDLFCEGLMICLSGARARRGGASVLEAHSRACCSSHSPLPFLCAWVRFK